MIEFKPWPKILRGTPFMVTITEKIDGTNGCIVIDGGEIVAVQSRKRFITPDDDNYGFAAWVEENEHELLGLGDGHHYGEWAGLGIQNNPLGLDRKEFFLFNTFRWDLDNLSMPSCCSLVPVLFTGKISELTIGGLIDSMRDEYDKVKREGVVVYYHLSRTYSKHTVLSPRGKWVEK